MRIQGNRVYLELPELPDTKVKLLPEAEQQYKEEMRAKFDRLKVYGVGEGVEGVKMSAKEGDEVQADPNALRRGVVLKIKDKEIICVNSFDIMHIW